MIQLRTENLGVILRRFLVHLQDHIPADWVADGEISARVDKKLRKVAVNFRKEFWAETAGEQRSIVVIETPANWFEHFKAQYFRGRILKIFPVKFKKEYKTVVFVQRFVYPTLALATDLPFVSVNEVYIDDVPDNEMN